MTSENVEILSKLLRSACHWHDALIREISYRRPRDDEADQLTLCIEGQIAPKDSSANYIEDAHLRVTFFDLADIEADFFKSTGEFWVSDLLLHPDGTLQLDVSPGGTLKFRCKRFRIESHTAGSH